MTVLDDLISSREQFKRFGGKSIRAAHMGACCNSPTSLRSLVALRESLPEGYPDFHHFENSREWSAKKAYAVFDRAISRNSKPPAA